MRAAASPQRADGLDDDRRRPHALRRRQHLLAVGLADLAARAVPVGGRCLLALRLLRPSTWASCCSSASACRTWIPACGSTASSPRSPPARSARRSSSAPCRSSTGGDPAAVATNLAYPLGDMILLASVIGAMAAGRSRLDRSWLWFGAGIAAFAVSDSIYLLQIAKDTYVGDTLLDIGWLVAGVLVGIAAWQPSRAQALHRRRAAEHHRADRARPRQPRAARLRPLPPASTCSPSRSSAAALVAVLIRLSLTHRESRSNLVTTRVQARTDSLTGLGNRFALQRALEHALGDPAPHVLLLFDLDGFKNYNDSYGHPAGDALLTRLGSALAAATAADGSRLPRRRRRVLRPRAVAGRPGARRADRARSRRAVRAGRGLHDRRLGRLRAAPRRGRGRRRGDARRRSPSLRREAQRPDVGPAAERGRAAQRAERVGRRAGRPHQRRRGARRAGRAAPRPRRGRRSSASRSPPSCTTSARSPSRARSCTSPARSMPTSGTTCAATR